MSNPLCICRRIVPIDEAILDDGKYYHERCWLQLKAKRFARLQRKQTTGEITLEEAQEMADLQITIPNIYKELGKPVVKLPTKPKQPMFFKGRTLEIQEQTALLPLEKRLSFLEKVEKEAREERVKLLPSSKNSNKRE